MSLIIHVQTAQTLSQNFTSHYHCFVHFLRQDLPQNKLKSLVNIVGNLHCLLESLLDSKIAEHLHLNQVLVKFLINKSAVL